MSARNQTTTDPVQELIDLFGVTQQDVDWIEYLLSLGCTDRQIKLINQTGIDGYHACSQLKPGQHQHWKDIQ